ncbi:restriction endonuclease subunit S [Paenibacillus antibioticophila]|uniref:Restriction endonuclease subunit S n=1 Tax=Paenibacillus antibioticophila TaxID=1274374 RepID=A0A919XSY4_9BACL|nr:restriction endonuclease subunit S [Paenibacillus antibioticophila]GIO35763.1 restriction endonuclease subunit S [Paenibacillus antibioticophila]
MIPSLRFEGFSGQWKSTTIGAVSKSIDYGLNVAATYFDGENKYVRITDIDEESHLYIEQNKVSPEGSMTDEYLVKEGDVLLARTGASTGKSYMYRSEDGKMYFAGFLIRLRILETVDHRFIYYQTLRSHYNRWVKVMSMRSGQPGINASEYSGFEFNIPTIDEQKKISSFFALLDQKIEKQQEKFKQLVLLKKGLLQKIFSQVIRFKDENGQDFPDWERVALNDLGSFVRNYSYSRSIEGEGEYQHIHYGDIHSKLMGIITSETELPSLSIDTEATYTLLEDGDIVFADASEDTSDLGKSVVLLEVDNRKIIGGLHTHCFRPDSQIDSLFLHYFTQTTEYRKFINVNANGVSVFGLSKPALSSLEIPLPDINEQRKISSFLYKLSQKIELLKKRKTELEVMKKGFISQMFV